MTMVNSGFKGLNRFLSRSKHNYLELNIAFKYRIAIQLILNHLEVVMLGGERQIQMGYNFN